jgi:hypothetical protein
VQARALDIAQRFLQAVGFSQGLFNMEFFHDPASDRITVIEFNPRLASQFSDLYLRTTGADPHAMAVALALGRNPAEVPRRPVQAGAAASLVYRAFTASQVPPAPGPAQRRALAEAFPDALLHCFFKQGPALQRELKWLGSHRYATLHLQGRDEAELRQRAEAASRLLGWPAPYLDESPQPTPPTWADASLPGSLLSPSLQTPLRTP